MNTLKIWLAAGIIMLSGFSFAEDKDDSGRHLCIIKEDAQSLIVLDADGKKVKLTKNPRRVVIGFTSLVNLWYYAGGKAVGIPNSRSRENIHAEAVKATRIGTFSNLNMEKIISLNPDLAILYANVNNQRVARDILASNNTETILLSYRNYSDFTRILDLFVRLNTGNPEKGKAASLMVKKIDAIIEKTGKLKKPGFLSFLFSGSGLSAETNLANTAHMAMLLGGRNIVTGKNVPKGSGRVSFSMEKVMLEDPDIILVATMGNEKKLAAKMEKTLANDPVWASLSAVKAGRVYFLPNELFLYRANEKYAEAFLTLAKLMYPEEKWD
ncbi:MAG: ABC transporter substrate-binding protein [Victivallales bacterium]|nr:ABC transporter substrate-binding protein [Victivallales bacterium]